MHTSIYHQFLLQLNQAGLFSQWISFAATTYRAQSGHPGGDGGEGDSTGGPIPARGFKAAWPTFVIVAGMSETMSALRMDMRWWFVTSHHDVKIVLLVKFDSIQQSMILKRWEEEGRVLTRPGATTTRSAAEVEPVLRQRISITKDAAEQGRYNVASGDLDLSF